MGKTGLCLALITALLFSSSTFAADATDIYVATSFNRLSIGFNNADLDDTEGGSILLVHIPAHMDHAPDYVGPIIQLRRTTVLVMEDNSIRGLLSLNGLVDLISP